METLKNKKLIIYVVMGLLSVLSLYSEIVACVGIKTLDFTIELIVFCIMLALILYYAIVNFKVPHGNLLKYLFIAFSAMTFVGLLAGSSSSGVPQEDIYLYQLLRGVVVIASAYIGGRLDRIKENIYYIIVCAFILLGTSIVNIVLYDITDFISIVFFSNFFILWLDLALAYIFRYYGHKEAEKAE